MSSGLYNTAAVYGKVEMGISMIICGIIAMIIYIVAYYNYKNWNHNLIEIVGTVKSINNPGGKCEQVTSNQTSYVYNCYLTVSYIVNNSSSTVDLVTNDSLYYIVDQKINLSYDTSLNGKPTLPVFRIETKWIVLIGTIFLLIAYIDYKLINSESAKPFHAVNGAIDITDAAYNVWRR